MRRDLFLHYHECLLGLLFDGNDASAVKMCAGKGALRADLMKNIKIPLNGVVSTGDKGTVGPNGEDWKLRLENEGVLPFKIPYHRIDILTGWHNIRVNQLGVKLLGFPEEPVAKKKETRYTFGWQLGPQVVDLNASRALVEELALGSMTGVKLSFERSGRRDRNPQ